MSPDDILEIVKAVFRELLLHKGIAAVLFLGVLFCTLALGYIWPQNYVTRTLLYADETNIIEPLLEGRASVTAIDHANRAREVLYTRRIMEKVAAEVGLFNEQQSPRDQDGILKMLRGRTKLQTESGNYFHIEYIAPDPDESFRSLNAIVKVFIEDSAESKRKESRDAYLFIDQQVKTYQSQLQAAELKLKEFKAKNLDGTEQSVSARIDQLRLQIEELKLAIDETQARRNSLRQQLASESAFQAQKSKVDGLRERVQVLQSQLDTLRLSYRDTYPDIVSLKDQINDLEWQIETAEAAGAGYTAGSGSGSEGSRNPLYEELRNRLAEAEVEVRSQKNRLSALQKLLEEEYERGKRVAEKQATLSELTRDYDVTREIYEEMLGRKEKARLSMTLDIEGQGVSYKIQEPANFPLEPSGLRFIHFAIIAPVLALLAPLGLAAVYVVLDPRIRFSSSLESLLPEGVEVIGVVPHMRTAIGNEMARNDYVVLGSVCVLGIILYGVVVGLVLNGTV